METLTWTPLATWKTKFDIRFLLWCEGKLIAADIYLRTWIWTDGGWTSLVTADADRMRDGSNAQHMLAAWNDAAIAICGDGKVLALDLARKQWSLRAEADSAFKASWALSTFDRERGRIVVWGPTKKSRGRKDETYVFDGTRWEKCKKGKAAFDDTKHEDMGFAVYFDPQLGAVVRVGQTSAGVFDGKAWSQLPLDGGDALDNWDRISCSDPAGVLIVQRFVSRCDVVRVQREDGRFVASRVATFPPAVTRRAIWDAGSNAAFDAGVYDASARRFLAFDDQKNAAYTADLSSLF